jgi:hypothetical protein
VLVQKWSAHDREFLTNEDEVLLVTVHRHLEESVTSTLHCVIRFVLLGSTTKGFGSGSAPRCLEMSAEGSILSTRWLVLGIIALGRFKSRW